ncbi:unnamed protein product [Allacma fusca]|uniref:Putative treble-clef zinc-finger domain-containing protein n=1 Tax=Allacma fusca TaxID=39272 RepID=A0A8J2Q112_9HEXA|nr:unnamed protein product [Allacma fusca]
MLSNGRAQLGRRLSLSGALIGTQQPPLFGTSNIQNALLFISILGTGVERDAWFQGVRTIYTCSMPQTPADKWKALFADLGRPTLRGIRKCPKCGTINGTRGNSCKNKSCDVVFRDNGMKKKAFTDACKLILPDFACDQMYSVRLRDRGPDYRNFVQIPLIEDHQTPVVTISECRADISLISSQKCFVESCNSRGRQFPCSHLIAAQKCFADSQPLPIKHSVLPSLNIPEESKEVINLCLVDNSDTLVQRVSSTSFVVRCDVSQRHPLGLLHIMFFKPNKYESLDKRFLCACRPYKQNREDPLSNNANNGFEPSNKYCMHYYACICAFASSDALSSEFEFVLSQVATEFTPTLLSQLHLVTLPSNSNRDIETLDPNQISVEIMRENISLLESIAAADDTSLPNGLDGVLADQIIVTNVDDGFSLGDSGLDDLGEADQQVCQIFSSNQNIQIQSTYSTTDTTDVLVNSGIPTKRRKDDSDKVVHDTGPPGSDQLIATGISNDKPMMGRKNIAIRPANNKTVVPQIAIIGTVNLNPPSTSNHSPMEKKSPVLGFEEWLAGVNERINLLMNYQLPGNPEPLVYMVYQDFFECLKDRITSGYKKKRLPNQTAIIQRLDASPKKTFTKHVWKITNLVQLLQIFSCSLVPLKPTQYFIKTANDVYEEWTSTPKEAEDSASKNQPIAPILHSTFIKIGKSDQNSKEKDWASFVIEWIPDLLPASKMGELTLRFEFGHTRPKLNS